MTFPFCWTGFYSWQNTRGAGFLEAADDERYWRLTLRDHCEEAMEEGRQRGMKAGLEEGRTLEWKRLNRLNEYLLRDNRTEELQCSLTDRPFQETLLKNTDYKRAGGNRMHSLLLFLQEYHFCSNKLIGFFVILIFNGLQLLYQFIFFFIPLQVQRASRDS